MDIQYGQAMVFTPCDFAFPTNGVKAEATPNTEMILIADVDLDLLNEPKPVWKREKFARQKERYLHVDKALSDIFIDLAIQQQVCKTTIYSFPLTAIKFV